MNEIRERLDDFRFWLDMSRNLSKEDIIKEFDRLFKDILEGEKEGDGE